MDSRFSYTEAPGSRTPPPAPGSCSEPPQAFAVRGRRIEQVMTDNAWAYRKSRLFADAMNRIGAAHIFTRPYRPQTNGKAERFHQTLLRGWAYKHAYTSNQQTASSPDLKPRTQTPPHPPFPHVFAKPHTLAADHRVARQNCQQREDGIPAAATPHASRNPHPDARPLSSPAPALQERENPARRPRLRRDPPPPPPLAGGSRAGPREPGPRARWAAGVKPFEMTAARSGTPASVFLIQHPHSTANL